MNAAKYKHKQLVQKTSGYKFDGIIVAVFQNTLGEWRYVVEHAWIVGMLHIFNEEQLEPREAPLKTFYVTDSDKVEKMEHELKHWKACAASNHTYLAKIRELENRNVNQAQSIHTLQYRMKNLQSRLDTIMAHIENVKIELEANDE